MVNPPWGAAEIRVGLPKGRLLPFSQRVLDQLRLDRDSELTYRIVGGGLTVWLLKVCDIPRLVAAGALDVGLAPTEWVEETGASCRRLTESAGYEVRVSLLATAGWKGRVRDLERLRVATEYPNIARRHLAGRADKLSVVEVHGSAEAFPPELADVVMDCVETGATAERHGLVEIERLFDCNLHVIAGRGAAESQLRVAKTIGGIVAG
jgi:ATP phosphoribosyltransferase